MQPETLTSTAIKLAFNAAMLAIIENHQRRQAEAFARIEALLKEKADA